MFIFIRLTISLTCSHRVWVVRGSGSFFGLLVSCFGLFLGVAETIVDSLLFCVVSIDQCLLSKSFVFHSPTYAALQFL